MATTYKFIYLFIYYYYSLKNETIPDGHCDSGMHFPPSFSLMKPFLQKHPTTHCFVQNGFLLAHVGGQAVPHFKYSSFLPHLSGKT